MLVSGEYWAGVTHLGARQGHTCGERERAATGCRGWGQGLSIRS